MKPWYPKYEDIEPSVPGLFTRTSATAIIRKAVDLARAHDSPELESLREEILRKKEIIRQTQEALERKNRELDALHFVWCSGGCESGVHRWSENTLTEELVREAEVSVARMRSWLNNHEYRKKST